MTSLVRQIAALLALAVALPLAAFGKDVTILNVSYDPTRELYQEYSAAFAKYWKARTGDNLTVKASHGGSGRQARFSDRRTAGRCRHAGACL